MSSSQSRLLSGQSLSHNQGQNDRQQCQGPNAHLTHAPVSSSIPDASASTRPSGGGPSVILSDHRSGSGQGIRQPDSRHARVFVADTPDMIQTIDESLPHNVIVHSNEADTPDIRDCVDTFPTNVAAVSTHYLPEHVIAYGDTFDIGGELST